MMAYAGGGVLINQSIHTLDLMHLLGGEIKELKGLSVIYLIMGLKSKIQQQPILNLKMEPQACFLQRIPTLGIPVSNFRLYWKMRNLRLKIVF